MGMCLIPIVTTLSSEIPELDDMAHKIQENQKEGKQADFIKFGKMSTANVCNKRLKDVFIDMINLGYF
jgi:hypothetical protein